MRPSEQRLLHGTAVGGRADAKALLDERARDQFADLAMIVDDQDMRGAGHRDNIGKSAG